MRELLKLKIALGFQHWPSFGLYFGEQKKFANRKKKISFRLSNYLASNCFSYSIEYRVTYGDPLGNSDLIGKKDCFVHTFTSYFLLGPLAYQVTEKAGAVIKRERPPHKHMNNQPACNDTKPMSIMDHSNKLRDPKSAQSCKLT